MIVAEATTKTGIVHMQITTIGLDIAKLVFQVHGVDAEGQVVVRKKLRRGEVLRFFQGLRPCVVGLEACATAHFWARELAALGHDVRLMAPSYVKAYLRRQKNDAADAEAICEAVTRPTMRFVPIKSAERQGVLVLHRTRELLVRQRTMLINAIRGHCAEFGLVAPQGARRAEELIEQVRQAEIDTLPDLARSGLLSMARQLDALGAQIHDLERRLLAWHRQDRASLRLCDHPGRGDHHRHRALGHHHRPDRLPLRARAGRLPGPGSAAELVGWQGAAWTYLQDGRRLSAQAVGGGRHLGDPPGARKRRRVLELAEGLAGAPAGSRGHRGPGQQDRAYRLGGADARRGLSADGGLIQYAAVAPPQAARVHEG